MTEKDLLANIKKIRELKNLKQDYIADRLSISPRGYAKIESGESQLTISRFFDIAQALEITPEEIWGFDTKKIFHNCTYSGNEVQNNYLTGEKVSKLTEELLKSKDAQIQLLEKEIERLQKK